MRFSLFSHPSCLLLFSQENRFSYIIILLQNVVPSDISTTAHPAVTDVWGEFISAFIWSCELSGDGDSHIRSVYPLHTQTQHTGSYALCRYWRRSEENQWEWGGGTSHKRCRLLWKWSEVSYFGAFTDLETTSITKSNRRGNLIIWWQLNIEK